MARPDPLLYWRLTVPRPCPATPGSAFLCPTTGIVGHKKHPLFSLDAPLKSAERIAAVLTHFEVSRCHLLPELVGVCPAAVLVHVEVGQCPDARAGRGLPCCRPGARRGRPVLCCPSWSRSALLLSWCASRSASALLPELVGVCPAAVLVHVEVGQCPDARAGRGLPCCRPGARRGQPGGSRRRARSARRGAHSFSAHLFGRALMFSKRPRQAVNVCGLSLCRIVHGH